MRKLIAATVLAAGLLSGGATLASAVGAAVLAGPPRSEGEWIAQTITVEAPAVSVLIGGPISTPVDPCSSCAPAIVPPNPVIEVHVTD